MIGDDSTTNYHNIVTAFHKATARAGIEARMLEGTQGAAARPKCASSASIWRSEPNGRTASSATAKCAPSRWSGGLQEGGLQLGSDMQLIYKQTSGILPTLFPALDSIREDVLCGRGRTDPAAAQAHRRAARSSNCRPWQSRCRIGGGR